MSRTPTPHMEAQVDEDQMYDETDGDFRTSALSAMGALPWWIVSAALHAVLLLLAMLIMMGTKLVAEVTEDVPHAKIVELPPEKEKPVTKHEVKSKSQVNIDAQAERPFYTPEKLEVSDAEMETENEDRSEFPAKGHQDAVSTVPAEGTGTIGFMGVGSGGASGAFGWRSGGGRKRRAMKFGGSQRTEESVDMGLEWLKWHQEPAGYWDRLKYSGRDHSSVTGDPDNVGVSGLALLAFLGAGHTERHGTYKDTVNRAVKWIIENQEENGRWGKSHSQMYRNGIATMALSEAAGMGKVPETITAAQKAIDGLVDAQKPYEAWNYSAYSKHRTNHINDSSVTIWASMALKSGKVSGLRVPGSAFDGVMKWVDFAQDISDAKAGDYSYTGGLMAYRGRIDTNTKEHTKTNLLRAAGGVIRVFWGQNLDHPGIVGPCNYLLKNALPGQPDQDGHLRMDYYGWYYTTLLMFQKGGQHWENWNKAMQTVLLEKQIKGDPKEMGGSWKPVHTTVMGGRVFSTALNCLSLEVYYRYLPMYE